MAIYGSGRWKTSMAAPWQPMPRPANRYRLLVVHPGATWSTHDVFVGLTKGILGLGHGAVIYPLDNQINRAVHSMRAWHQHLKEQGNDTLREPTPAEIFFEASADIVNRAAFAGVDGVLLITSMYTPLQVLKALKWAHCPVGLVLSESPYDDEEQVKWAAAADVVWTNERTSVETFRAVNPNSFYLPAAYDPETHTSEPQEGDEGMPAWDVVFVGTGFPERIELLEAVDWTGINLGLYGSWEALSDVSPLLPFVRGGVTDNATTAALYRRAKVGLNLYRTSKGFEGKGHVTTAESLNPRAYEMAACGLCQIANHRAEDMDIFWNGQRHALTSFTNATNLGEVIRLRLPDLYRPSRAQLALKMVQPHTFTARAAQLMAQFAPVLDRTLTAAYG